MKALNELTNSGKGKLLFDLFPDEMPALVDHLSEVCENFSTKQERIKKDWDNGFMPFEYWLGLSQDCAAILKKHGHAMRKSSKIFSEQLFYGYTALFVNDRIVKYAQHWGSDKFKLAVTLIYH